MKRFHCLMILKILDIDPGFKGTMIQWFKRYPQGTGFPPPIFLLCHPLGQLHIVFGSRMLASPRTACFLNHIWQGRLHFSHCKY